METGTFLSVDPVESEPPYQYVQGNPVNWIDPTGLQPPPCTGDPTQICITQPIGSGTSEYPPQPSPPVSPPPPPPPKSHPTIGPLEDVLTCMRTDFFEGTGYAEGIADTISIGFNVAYNKGKEVVYNFATMERGVYDYNHTPLFDPNSFPPTPGLTTAGLEWARMIYDVQLQGFNSERSLDEEYSGYFVGHTIGLGSPVKIKRIPGTDKVTAGIGKIYVQSSEVYGSGDYSMAALGVSPIPVFAASLSATNYELRPGTHYNYGAAGFISEQTIEQIKIDIRSGIDSPWPPGTATYTRQRAINELDEIWEKHQDYFRFRYRGYH